MTQKQLPMKYLRPFFVTLLVCSFLSVSWGQTIEKVLVKSFNLQGAQEVVLKTTGGVTVQTWEQDILRIQMTIGLDQGGSDAMLKSLLQAGRYNLRAELVEGRLVIDNPGLERDVLRNGQPLAERISFVVFAPENLRVEVADGTSAGLDVQVNW